MMQSHPTAIFIDLDGTLADSLPVMRLSYLNFLDGFGVKGTDEEFASLNGPPLAEVVRRLKVTHSLPGETDTLVKAYFAVIDAAYAKVAPSHGAKYLLECAKARGCAVGVVTSNSRARADAWFDAVGIADLISFVVSGEDVSVGKPHPEPYLIAKERMTDLAGVFVAVEDSIQGAESALGAGLRTFVLTGQASGERWPEGAERISSLWALAEQLWPELAGRHS